MEEDKFSGLDLSELNCLEEVNTVLEQYVIDKFYIG